MRKYLLPEFGIFYKANLHCHTTVSDGGLTPEEVKTLYKEKGYSIIAYTDHDVMIAHDELKDDSFLPLHGYEMEVGEVVVDKTQKNAKTCHMCLIALDPDDMKMACYHRTKFVPKCSEDYRDKVDYDDTLPDYERVYSHDGVSDMMRVGRESGFFVTYNHPTWSLENYPEYIGYQNMHAMEIVNGSCNASGYAEHNERVYDDMLRAGNRIYCIAADDNHNKGAVGTRRFDSFGGFTMIKAESLDYKKVTDALVKGSFYASEGPLIHSLWVEDNALHIETSTADAIYLRTDRRIVKAAYDETGDGISSAVFTLDPVIKYYRLVVCDKSGKCAYTNAYFMDELNS